MAFFKFRKAADEPATAPLALQSLEAMRQRAKYRLLGASVLVLLGVVGFPLLFDKQPRPIAVDTPIDIPDRNKTQPLALPAAAAPEEALNVPATTPLLPVPVVTNGNKASHAAVLETEPGVITEMAQPAKSVKVIEPKVAKVPVSHASEAIKKVASDLPKPANAPAASDARFVVQVGAFADAARAQEVRMKLEHAGLKTYTHVAETKDGKRIRVRVGPFSAKPEAEKVASKIKKLDLPAALLTL